MKLPLHTIRQFANAMLALLPPGAAWRWAVDGFGDRIFQAVAVEFTRIELIIQQVLDRSITLHTPSQSLYTLAEYQRVADEAAAQFVEPLPRQASRTGRMRTGQRLWSSSAEGSSWPIAKVKVAHLRGPFVTGRSKTGQRLMSARSRFVLHVFYYHGVVNPDVIAAALQEFKQAHVALFFEDITGIAGNKYYV